MEFYATVIQVRCLSSYKTHFNPPCLHKKMPLPSQEFEVAFHLFNVFEFFIFLFDYGFSFFVFSHGSVFLLLYFS